MDTLKVDIVTLPPLRVACVNGFGASPEEQAFEKMRAWAKVHDLLGKPCRVFGYNNPDPAPGSPNYGYDVWMTVGDTVRAGGEARLLNFSGGLYATTRLEVKHPETDISGAWQAMVRWLGNSKYKQGPHQWLEEHIGPLEASDKPFILDLYFPIQE